MSFIFIKNQSIGSICSYYGVLNQQEFNGLERVKKVGHKGCPEGLVISLRSD